MNSYRDSDEQVERRHALVDGLKAKGVDDEWVLQAIRNLPRHLFMPGRENEAYIDKAFPIGEGQTISQPFTVAYQTELLAVEPAQKVLEIGTGSAYQAAVLAEMGAEVYTIERQKKLFERIQHFSYLKKYTNLHFCYGDGFLGWPSEAPFDRILITAAPEYVPESLVLQLRYGGYLVAPVGPPGLQRMLRITRQYDGRVTEEIFDRFAFVPMLPGKHQ